MFDGRKTTDKHRNNYLKKNDHKFEINKLESNTTKTYILREY